MAYPSLSKAEPFQIQIQIQITLCIFQMQVNKRDAISFAYLNKNSFIQLLFFPNVH